MIKRLLIAVVLLAIVCGGLVYFNMFRNQAIEQFFATRQQPAVPVQVVAAEPIAWRPGIEAIGTARAAQGIELSLETSGRIEAVNFASNDMVEAGQVLVQLDDDVEQAGLTAARAAVQLNEQTLERTLELRSRGVNAEANVEEARANAESAAAEVARLEAVLGQKTLLAPFSGTIGLPQVDEGQYVAAGTAVATLQDLGTMRVDFTVPEQQRAMLEIGQAIRLGSKEGSLDYQGRIIGIEPRIDPNTRLVTVRAEVENTENGLYPGQFVRVRVELPEEDGIIALPQTAVVTSLYGDYVFVVSEAETDAAAAEDDTAATAEAQVSDAPAGEGEETAPALEARQVFVTTGRTNGDMIEIVDGLEGGEQIVASGQNRLSNGASVTINETESPLERGQAVEQVRR